MGIAEVMAKQLWHGSMLAHNRAYMIPLSSKIYSILLSPIMFGNSGFEKTELKARIGAALDKDLSHGSLLLFTIHSL